jgi:two-component system nitrate/nitrite response regulator NarL
MAKRGEHGARSHADSAPVGADARRQAGLEVVVVSGVRMYAEGLSRALDADPAMTVSATLGDSAELAALLDERDPDVVLLDLAGLDDLEELRGLVRMAAPTPFVALAVRARDAEVLDWAEAGVMGLLTRDASLEDVPQLIRGVVRGAPPCSGAVSAALLRRVAAAARERPDEPPLPPLTAREREIAELLELGLSNKEIAARLYLGVSTVKNHVHNLLGKLEARSRAEAVARMRRAAALTGTPWSHTTRMGGRGAGT